MLLRMGYPEDLLRDFLHSDAVEFGPSFSMSLGKFELLFNDYFYSILTELEKTNESHSLIASIMSNTDILNSCYLKVLHKPIRVNGATLASESTHLILGVRERIIV